MEHFGHIPDNDPTDSPKPSTTSNPRWILGRVKMLMASYRLSDYHDPEGFLATLISILSDYPPEIVEYVTDPKTGIQRRNKWPPTPAEVVEACSAEIAWRTKVAQQSTLKPVPRLPSSRFSAADSYEIMFAKYGRPCGVFETIDDKWNKRRLAQG